MVAPTSGLGVNAAGAAGALSGTEKFPIIQASNNRYATPAQVAAFLGFSGTYGSFSLALGGATHVNALDIIGSATISANVAIGTTSLTSGLSIYGTENYGLLHITSAPADGNASIEFKSSNNTSGDIGCWLLGKNVGLSNNSFTLYNNGINRFTIDSTGNAFFAVNASGSVSIVNLTTAQCFRVYNTSSAANANFARGVFDTTTAGTLTIGTQTLGTGVGTFGKLQFISEGVNVFDYAVTKASAFTFAATPYTSQAAFIARSSIALTNGAGASAGTITNAPSVGNPTKWIPIDDNGTTRYIPAW